MTAQPLPFICLQISPPEASLSRLRALGAQRRGKRLAAKPFNLKAAPTSRATVALRKPSA